MTQSILVTKTTMPPVPRTYLARPGLDGSWDSWAEQRLVLVVAGAGYGKTTFLAASARRGTRPVSWLTVDEHDVDPGFFVPHLLHALRPGLEKKAARWDSAADDYLARALTLAVGELHRVDEGRAVILDDVHTLAVDSQVMGFLVKLARYLPGRNTLILASRVPIPIRAMKLRGELPVDDLTTADLALDATEIAKLHELHDRKRLKSETAALIAERTEGWPAGVEILFQSLHAESDATPLEDLVDGGSGESGWFTYFAEEVIRGLDESLREFLIRSSILPQLDSDLCDEVLARDDSRRQLEWLSQRHLFTVRLGPRGGSYRYHHLFRDFLRHRLDCREPTSVVAKLQRRAAHVLCRREHWTEALAAACDAGDHGLIVELARDRGEELLASGRFEAVRTALTSVPAGRLRKHARALRTLGRACEGLGEWQEAEQNYRRALKAARSGRLRVEMMSLIAQLKQRQGRSRSCVRLCRKALAEPGRIDSATRGRLFNMLGVASCDMGHLEQGEEHLRRAVEVLGSQLGPEDTARMFYLLESNIHYRRGDFQRAKTRARRALGVFRKRGDAWRVCHSLGVLAHITADCCEDREARTLAFECLRMAESLEYYLMEGYAHLALGQCASRAGDLEGARDHFRRAADLGEQLGERGLLWLPLMALADNALLRRRTHEARALANRVLAYAERGRDVYLEARAAFLLGRLAHRRSAVEARRWWDRAERIMRRVGMHFDLHHLLLVRLLHERRGSDKRLRKLMTGVETWNHDFLFHTIERVDAPGILARALRDGIRVDMARRLLEDIGDDSSPVLAELLAEPDIAPVAAELLSRIDGPRARLILASRDKTASAATDKDAAEGPALHIRALGQLHIGIENRHLTMADWRSTRALRLFQILLTRRFRWVPSDVIIEMLWPDCRADKGRNNLRQTIHVLRRTLQPELETPRTSRFIRHHQEAIRLDPGVGYSYDLEDCEAVLNEVEMAWNAARPEEARTALARAHELYRGPFLEESLYEEFAAVEREQLRDRYLRSLERMAQHLAKIEQWQELVPLCRRVLTLDRYQENIHFLLVRALTLLGQRHEALTAYQHFEDIMVGELDLLPSSRMKTLAEDIAQR